MCLCVSHQLLLTACTRNRCVPLQRSCGIKSNGRQRDKAKWLKMTFLIWPCGLGLLNHLLSGMWLAATEKRKEKKWRRGNIANYRKSPSCRTEEEKLCHTFFYKFIMRLRKWFFSRFPTHSHVNINYTHTYIILLLKFFIITSVIATSPRNATFFTL